MAGPGRGREVREVTDDAGRRPLPLLQGKQIVIGQLSGSQIPIKAVQPERNKGYPIWPREISKTGKRQQENTGYNIALKEIRGGRRSREGFTFNACSMTRRDTPVISDGSHAKTPRYPFTSASTIKGSLKISSEGIARKDMGTFIYNSVASLTFRFLSFTEFTLITLIIFASWGSSRP
ncbi:hypothetical protein Tco_0443195 [Tanacetum coccineum]